MVEDRKTLKETKELLKPDLLVRLDLLLKILLTPMSISMLEGKRDIEELK